MFEQLKHRGIAFAAAHGVDLQRNGDLATNPWKCLYILHTIRIMINFQAGIIYVSFRSVQRVLCVVDWQNGSNNWPLCSSSTSWLPVFVQCTRPPPPFHLTVTVEGGRWASVLHKYRQPQIWGMNHDGVHGDIILWNGGRGREYRNRQCWSNSSVVLTFVVPFLVQYGCLSKLWILNVLFVALVQTLSMLLKLKIEFSLL